MIGKRTATQWRATFHLEPSLSYAEAVFWIAFRDLGRMEAAFDSPRSIDADAPSWIDAWAALNDEWREDWDAADPRGQLENALRLGLVKATGCRTVPMTLDQWAMTDREPIPVDAWCEVEIADGQGRWEDLTAALRPRLVRMHTMEGGWLNVRFDGESFRQAFPGAGVLARFPGRAANENASAPAIIEFSERHTTLALALEAVEARGLEPSKGNLAVECARLYREQWGKGRTRSPTVEGVGEGIERQWAAKGRERTKDWLLARARRGKT